MILSALHRVVAATALCTFATSALATAHTFENGCPLAIQPGEWLLEVTNMTPAQMRVFRGGTANYPIIGGPMLVTASCESALTMVTVGGVSSKLNALSTTGDVPLELKGGGGITTGITAEWFVILNSPTRVRRG